MQRSLKSQWSRRLLCQVGQFTLLSHGHIMSLPVSYKALLQTFAAGLASLSSFHCFHSCSALMDSAGVFELLPTCFRLHQCSLSWVSQALKVFSSGGRNLYTQSRKAKFLLSQRSYLVVYQKLWTLVLLAPTAFLNFELCFCVRGEDLCRGRDGVGTCGDTAGEQRGEAAAPKLKGFWKSHRNPVV